MSENWSSSGSSTRDSICILLFCSYRLRVESMLLKADFECNMGFLDPTIEAILAAGEGQSLSNQRSLL